MRRCETSALTFFEDWNSKKSAREGFDVIFDVIPPISLYQILVVFCGIWLSVPAGAIQVAPIVLQADPGNFKW